VTTAFEEAMPHHVHMPRLVRERRIKLKEAIALMTCKIELIGWKVWSYH
jgi:hypothetical protein